MTAKNYLLSHGSLVGKLITLQNGNRVKVKWQDGFILSGDTPGIGFWEVNAYYEDVEVTHKT